jgi:hypothetical protein
LARRIWPAAWVLYALAVCASALGRSLASPRLPVAAIAALAVALLTTSFAVRASLLRGRAPTAASARWMQLAWVLDVVAACCGPALAAAGDVRVAAAIVIAAGVLLAMTPPKILG